MRTKQSYILGVVYGGIGSQRVEERNEFYFQTCIVGEERERERKDGRLSKLGYSRTIPAGQPTFMVIFPAWFL